MPLSSSGLTPSPWVIRPPAIVIFRAEPPGLTLSAVADSLTTTPLTREVACPSVGLDTPAHSNLANRLAYLDADGPIGVGYDPLEFRGLHSTRIDIEAARSLSERFDRRVHPKQLDGPKIDKADATWSVRGNFLVSDPVADGSPIVENHIVGP